MYAAYDDMCTRHVLNLSKRPGNRPSVHSPPPALHLLKRTVKPRRKSQEQQEPARSPNHSLERDRDLAGLHHLQLIQVQLLHDRLQVH